MSNMCVYTYLIPFRASDQTKYVMLLFFLL